MKKLFAIFILVLFLASCRSTRVTKSTETKKEVIDSSGMESIDSSWERVDSTVSVSTVDEETGVEITVDFDPSMFEPAGPDDIKTEELPDPVFTIDSSGTITISGPVKTIKIKEKAKTHKVDVVEKGTVEKGTVEKEKTVDVHKEAESKVVNVEKKKCGFPTGISLLIFVTVLGVAFYFIYFRKRL